MKDTDIRKVVRENYAQVVKGNQSCCSPAGSCRTDQAGDISRQVGYTEEDIQSVPDGANLGLGCGNPVALASLAAGEMVLDLGSGAGFDCFLASGKVGEGGKVIGVDMTPEMVEQARENARKGGYQNVEFRLGEIEHIPAADSSVDVVISNCVINLSPDKPAVFRDAFRVLRPGGRLMVSDIVLLADLPDFIRSSIAAYVGCISGALRKEDYLAAITGAGFGEVRVMDETTFPVELMLNDPTAGAIIDKLNLTREKAADMASSVVSIKVSAVKPA